MKELMQVKSDTYLDPPFIKWGGGLSFRNFLKKRGEGSDFPHKKGGVGKIGGYLKKRGLFKKKRGGTLSLIFIWPNPFQSYLLQSEWWLCFAYLHLFYQYSVSHGKNLVLMNLINRYVTSTSQ